ncbi:MAG TPA: class I SAM-dependent methyltransferase [Candidatus Polarisedimenticolaceae bacterium]|nr:class I SAM-dependent methyltransferase [Candidatus Polarisedimenticolaceae bacterium]
MTEHHDAYRGFAAHYDLHMMDWYASVYGPRLRENLRTRGLAAGKVLDAGCGTGTLALQLAAAGYEMTGVDLSPALLEKARAKDRDEKVRWMQGDITRLSLEETFDGITCVSDVLNHLSSIEEWEQALRGFHRHLNPGGWLFFDSMTSHGLAELDAYSTHDRPERCLIMGVIWEPATRRSTLKITSFVPVDGTVLWERATETITEWGQPVSDICARLAAAGFQAPERLWPREDDPEKEERLAVLVRR